jgi:hypothetical protein
MERTKMWKQKTPMWVLPRRSLILATIHQHMMVQLAMLFVLFCVQLKHADSSCSEPESFSDTSSSETRSETRSDARLDAHSDAERVTDHETLSGSDSEDTLEVKDSETLRTTMRCHQLGISMSISMALCQTMTRN